MAGTPAQRERCPSQAAQPPACLAATVLGGELDGLRSPLSGDAHAPTPLPGALRTARRSSWRGPAAQLTWLSSSRLTLATWLSSSITHLESARQSFFRNVSGSSSSRAAAFLASLLAARILAPAGRGQAQGPPITPSIVTHRGHANRLREAAAQHPAQLPRTQVRQCPLLGCGPIRQPRAAARAAPTILGQRKVVLLLLGGHWQRGGSLGGRAGSLCWLLLLLLRLGLLLLLRQVGGCTPRVLRRCCCRCRCRRLLAACHRLPTGKLLVPAWLLPAHGRDWSICMQSVPRCSTLSTGHRHAGGACELVCCPVTASSNGSSAC